VKLCTGAGTLGMHRKSTNPQATDKAEEAVLILLYCRVTMPSRYAVKSTADPQATEEAERLQ